MIIKLHTLQGRDYHASIKLYNFIIWHSRGIFTKLHIKQIKLYNFIFW